MIYPGFAGGDRTDICAAREPAEAARGAARNGQAGRAGPDHRHRRWPSSGRRRTCRRSWSPGIRDNGRQRGRRRAVRRRTTRPAACRDVLQGKEKLAAFEDYPKGGPNYRYFSGQALYPFGHGLSYSLRILGAAAGSFERRADRPTDGAAGEERWEPNSRRSRAVVPACARSEGAACAQGSARCRACLAGGWRITAD